MCVVHLWLCYTQHHTLACLSDVVEYFVAKVGPSARPLHIDMAALKADSQSPRAHSAIATVGRIPPSRNATSSSSAGFTQFVYSNPAVSLTSGVASTRSSLGSSGHSDTRSLSPPSPSDHRLSAAAAAPGTSSVSSEIHTATDNSTSQLALLLSTLSLMCSCDVSVLIPWLCETFYTPNTVSLAVFQFRERTELTEAELVQLHTELIKFRNCNDIDTKYFCTFRSFATRIYTIWVIYK